MREWTTIRLTEAAQVLELIGDDDAPPVAEGQALRSFYEEARGRDAAEAVRVIGHALPRRDALIWASHMLELEAKASPPDRASRHALDCVARWLDDPEDSYRRACYDAAKAAPDMAAARLLAMGAFMSGGSIAPEDSTPVLPDETSCLRITVGAVIKTAYQSEDTNGFLERALLVAEDIAALGAKAALEADTKR